MTRAIAILPVPVGGISYLPRCDPFGKLYSHTKLGAPTSFKERVHLKKLIDPKSLQDFGRYCLLSNGKIYV